MRCLIIFIFSKTSPKNFGVFKSSFIEFSNISIKPLSAGLDSTSETTFNRILEIVKDVESNPTDQDFIDIFENSMNDDLNTPKFLGEVFEKINIVKNLNDHEEQKFKETLKYIFEILGFTFDVEEKIQISDEDLKNFFSKFQIRFTSVEQAMNEYLSKREKFRKNKNFDQADLMRDRLKEIGLFIKDGENGGWYWENR